jgi:hypothetical protein
MARTASPTRAAAAAAAASDAAPRDDADADADDALPPPPPPPPSALPRYESTPLLARVLFSWVTPLIARRGAITLEDFWPLPAANSTRAARGVLDAWDAEVAAAAAATPPRAPSLARAALRVWTLG